MKKILLIIIVFLITACYPSNQPQPQTSTSTQPIPKVSPVKPPETDMSKENTPSPLPSKTEESNFDKSNDGIDVTEKNLPEATEFTTTNPVYLSVDEDWQESPKPSYIWY